MSAPAAARLTDYLCRRMARLRTAPSVAPVSGSPFWADLQTEKYPVNWLPPALTAFVAVLTATVGYFITNRLKTLEVRRATYASALLAVETYWRMPYRIRRRADSRPETRGALGERISDAERDLDYYINLMDLDVDDVAARYRALALETRARGTAMRAQAWCMPPADRDDAMPFPERYPDEDRSALEHRDNLHKCKTAMRRRLRLLALR